MSKGADGSSPSCLTCEPTRATAQFRMPTSFDVPRKTRPLTRN